MVFERSLRYTWRQETEGFFMKILILTGKFGNGHWSASLSLKEELLRQDPRVQVEVADFFAYALDEGAEAVYKGFSLLVTHGSALYNMYYNLTQNQKRTSPDLLAALFSDKLARLLDRESPDLLIATHPFCAQVIAAYKAETGNTIPLVTCVTDLSSHSEWVAPGTDGYLVGSPLIRRALAAKGVDPGRILVTGIPVRSDFKAPRRSNGSGRRHLLIMGGGLGLMPRSDRFYEALNALPDTDVTILTGTNEKLRRRLTGKYTNIEVVGFTDRVADYMASADLLLSKPGGITLFEAIFSELPILAWAPFLQQEINNAKFLVAAEIGATAEKEQEACLAAIRSLLYDDGALAAMRCRMRAMKGQLEGESLSALCAALGRRKGACA